MSWTGEPGVEGPMGPPSAEDLLRRVVETWKRCTDRWAESQGPMACYPTSFREMAHLIDEISRIDFIKL